MQLLDMLITFFTKKTEHESRACLCLAVVAAIFNDRRDEHHHVILDVGGLDILLLFLLDKLHHLLGDLISDVVNMFAAFEKPLFYIKLE